MNEKQVLEAWNRRKSIKGTARELEISEGVVKKYLIGLGIYKSPLTERIAELRAAGMPPKDIAAFLGISESTVSSNMPYIKTSYLNENKTVNAMRIKESRRKKHMTINLFRVYGLLGHEKQPIFAACDARPENPYELVEAELPDGWNVWENDCYERILEDPSGTSYPLVKCLHTVKDTPFIAWAYADGNTADIPLKWRYANNTVRGLREQRGYTQDYLSQKTGINVRLLRKLELGEINIENITAKNLLNIADALDVEPTALFSE